MVAKGPFANQTQRFGLPKVVRFTSGPAPGTITGSRFQWIPPDFTGFRWILMDPMVFNGFQWFSMVFNCCQIPVRYLSDICQMSVRYWSDIMGTGSAPLSVVTIKMSHGYLTHTIVHATQCATIPTQKHGNRNIYLNCQPAYLRTVAANLGRP